MNLNRTQRRWFTRKSPEGKRMLKLPFMHPDKVESRRANAERGREQHESFMLQIQERIVERLGDREKALMDSLKEKKVLKTNIDHYMEVWSGVNFWPKPNDFQALRKELKKLNKEYGVNG